MEVAVLREEEEKVEKSFSLPLRVTPINSFEQASRKMSIGISALRREFNDRHCPLKTITTQPKVVSLEYCPDMDGIEDCIRRLDGVQKSLCDFSSNYLLGLVHQFSKCIPMILWDNSYIVAVEQSPLRCDGRLYYITVKISHGKMSLQTLGYQCLRGDIWVLAEGYLQSPFM